LNYCDLLYLAKCSMGPISQNIMRSSACFELIYVKSGNVCGTLYFEGGLHHIEANQVIVLPSDVNYRFDFVGTGECIFIGFCGCNHDFHNAPAVYYDNEQHVVSHLLDLMVNEFVGQNYHRKQMINLLLNTALITICRISKSADIKKEVEADNFNYILHFMDAQSQNGIDIEEIAKMSGLSYHRFRHRFKELTGISPQQYIIKQRLNFARRLLITTSYSTSSIATACGFHSVPQFITCFSRQEGLTPVKYRKKHLIDTKQ
jgi:AraC-like DNA-binding protein